MTSSRLDVQRENLVHSGKLPSSATVYEGVQNVAVRVSSLKWSSSSSYERDRRGSLLFNCHFDTVSLSPGAGDNAAACGIMLELLDTVVKEDLKLSKICSWAMLKIYLCRHVCIRCILSVRRLSQ
jgi:hypothetical protein